MTTRTKLRLLDAGMIAIFAGLAVSCWSAWIGLALIFIGMALIAPMFARIKRDSEPAP